jgi:ribonuclease E
MELSRQKKQSTIQEISYTPCPFCRGRGVRPSLEYTALTAYRKIESQTVKGLISQIKVNLPYEVADYLLNQKRPEITHLESEYDMSIHISGNPDMAWDECRIETTKREALHPPEPVKLALETEEPLKETEGEELEEPEEKIPPALPSPEEETERKACGRDPGCNSCSCNGDPDGFRNKIAPRGGAIGA